MLMFCSVIVLLRGSMGSVRSASMRGVMGVRGQLCKEVNHLMGVNRRASREWEVRCFSYLYSYWSLA